MFVDAQVPSPPAFQFSVTDERLLEQANELDQQYSDKGLLYRDPSGESVLNRVGTALTNEGPPPERVIYSFRILRDPMINAFALPNGSVYVTTGLLSLLENDAQPEVVNDFETPARIN